MPSGSGAMLHMGLVGRRGEVGGGEGGGYTSQGERPWVDFVRQLLNSCGISYTVQIMAPVGGLGLIILCRA